MYSKIVASALVAIGSVVLHGCGGGSSGGGYSGFALVSQDVTLKEVSIDQGPGGIKGTGSGRFFMGFDDIVGFGMDFCTKSTENTEEGEKTTEQQVYFQYNLLESSAHFCLYDSAKAEAEQTMCYKANVTDKVDKDKFNTCAQAEAKKLTVTDKDGLHSVNMVTPEAQAEMDKEESLKNVKASLLVDDSNMIKKIVVSLAPNLDYTMETDSKAVTAESFATPAKFTEAYKAAQEKKDIAISFAMVPAETPLVPLLECIGFAPGNDGKPDQPTAPATIVTV